MSKIEFGRIYWSSFNLGGNNSDKLIPGFQVLVTSLIS